MKPDLRSFQDMGVWRQHPREARVLWARDYGALVYRDPFGWWATNDIRWDQVGLTDNDQLVQPTLGPFDTAEAALKAYNAAKEAE